MALLAVIGAIISITALVRTIRLERDIQARKRIRELQAAGVDDPAIRDFDSMSASEQALVIRTLKYQQRKGKTGRL